MNRSTDSRKRTPLTAAGLFAGVGSVEVGAVADAARGVMMRAALFVVVVLSVPAWAQSTRPSTTPASAAPAVVARTTPAACDALRQLSLDGVALVVTNTRWFAAGAPLPGARAGGPPPAPTSLPAYCRLDGVIDRRTGVPNGTTYGIGFAVAMPEAWNGRTLMQGGGGTNGSVGNPLGTSAAGDRSAMMRGFAVVSTDTGHTGSGSFDATFQQDQQASLDFAYAAIGRVAEIAKRIVTRQYGTAPAHSYFAGCSTGGREAMLVSQRYPLLFDAVIAGAPAMRTNYSGIGDRWVATTLNEVAPKDAQGQPITRQALSEPQKQGVLDGIAAACDAKDGIVDRMIFDVNACRFDPKTLVCGGSAPGDRCLSPQQAAALAKAFAGPRDSTGRQVYPGFPWDMGLASTQGVAGLLHGGQVVGGAGNTIGMDVDAAVERAQNDPGSPLSTSARWTNLNTFSGRGGKLLFWHGVSDPWFSALDTIDYYNRMTEANGGADKVREWSRLFLVPGAGHCGGGPALDRFDALGAMIRWVEDGVAPEHIEATGRAFPERSRPLCAYPLHAHYKGQGNPEDAGSFECRP
ncbi:MAG: tannase/feruloyl esterase family alpha/beta hydrolase [Vicinamibacterales bacterium]